MPWGFSCLWHWAFVFGLCTSSILPLLCHAFSGARLFCSHAWTAMNSRLRLETGQLEHVSLNGKSVQSFVLSWRAPGSSAVAKNTGIGNPCFRGRVRAGESPSTPFPKKGHRTQNITRLRKMGSSCNCIVKQELLSYLHLPSDLSHWRLFCPCLSKCKLLTGSLVFKMRKTKTCKTRSSLSSAQ